VVISIYLTDTVSYKNATLRVECEYSNYELYWLLEIGEINHVSRWLVCGSVCSTATSPLIQIL